MKKVIIGIILIFVLINTVQAQHKFYQTEDFYVEFPESTKDSIISKLNELFESIVNKEMEEDLLDRQDFEFNKNYFKGLGWITKSDGKPEYLLPQILQMYRFTGSDEYSITLSFTKAKFDTIPPTIYGICTFIAKKENDCITFSTPIRRRANNWKSKQVDELYFYYPDTLNIERAKLFVHKNREMASKFNLPVYPFQVYVTDNYQEIMWLLGKDYAGMSGKANSGYIVDPHTLFTVHGNEDFSHDALHMYAQHKRGKRNVTAEEGLAYLWGDAYYADDNGYIPNMNDLVKELLNYLEENKDKTLFDIFNDNPRFYSFGNRISPKSTMSAIICQQIEQQKGVDGIVELLNCQPGDDNYFISIEKLLNINRENFNEKVTPWVYNYLK